MFTYHTDLAYPTLPRVRVVVEPLPADDLPSPSPSPDDWRARCVVLHKTNGKWDVESPCGRYWLDSFDGGWMDYDKWTLARDDRKNNGMFYPESSARAALSLAPPYPGAPSCERSSGTASSPSVSSSLPASTSPSPTPSPRGGSAESLGSPALSASTSGHTDSPLPNPSEPVASGDPETYQLVFMGGELTMQPYTHGDWVKYSDHANHTASLRTELADTYIQLSQSQHEAEKAKGEIEMLTNVSNDQVNEITRLQSELAGVRERMEAAEKVCAIASIIHRGLTFTGEFGKAIDAWVYSRPLAPAEVSRG